MMLTTTERQTQIDRTLNRLIKGLVAKGFTFITPEASVQDLQERLTTFDQGRLGLTKKIVGFVMGMSDVPGVVLNITDKVITMGAEQVDDEDLADLQQLMRSSFPLCAVAFSKMYGPRFLAIVDGDDMTQSELLEAIENFEKINLYMLTLGGRLSWKLFGYSVFGINSSAATGSMLLLSSENERAQQLQQWVNSRPLRSDTAVNQLKQRLTSVSFWAKLAIGMVEYTPNQLRQEIITLNTETGYATSTASPRLAFEFGFSLEDISRVRV